MAVTQKNRLLSINTALGADALLIKDLSINDQLGRLFQIDVGLLSTNDSIDFNQIIGTKATVTIELPTGSKRYFNGYVSRFVQGERQQDFAYYRATLVPWLWFLTRTSDCHIFQNIGQKATQTVPDVIKAVFQAQGFGSEDDFMLQLTASYPTIEYCVQYRETAFNFVSRLMEREGIYYYFKHDNGSHKMVLIDDPLKHDPFPGYATVNYKPRTHKGAEATESVTDWVVTQEVQTGAYVLEDFNFTIPSADLVANASVSRQHAQSSYEMYDYPGEFAVRSEGDTYVKTRMQELAAQFEILHGQATSRGIATGCTFTLQSHPRDSQNRKYLVMSTSCQASVGGYGAAGGKDTGAEFFSCSFTAMPAATQFRSPRTTPKPLIQGPQTAMVVGQSGEEITTDQYGRVKVQFPWDRVHPNNQDSSCWVRVSQSWASNTWGAVVIPRIGQEVVVEFLEGDPDRPLVTGCVYNGTNALPYKLPDNKTRSVFKSNSSIGGDGFNEFRFEDKKGSEQIYLHGEKNQDIRIKNDSKELIGNDRHFTVKNDQKEKVEGDQHGKVTGDQKLKVDGDSSLQIKGDRKFKVQGAESQSVTGDRKVEISGKDNLHADSDQMVTVGGDAHFNASGNWNVASGAKISINASADLHEKAGTTYAMAAGTTVHIKGGTTVVIEAGEQLSIKAGASFVDLGPNGVSISGAMVNINSGGAAASGSGSSPTAPKAPDSPDDPDAPDDPKEPNDDNTDSS